MERKTAKIRVRKRPDVKIRFADGVLDCPTRTQCEIVTVLRLFPPRTKPRNKVDDVVELVIDLMLHGY